MSEQSATSPQPAQRSATLPDLANDRFVRQRDALISLASKAPAADLDSRLQQITEAAARTLEVSRASIWRYSPDGNELVCLNLYDRQAGHSSGQRLAKSSCPAYFRELECSEVLDVPDPLFDPRTREFAAGYLIPLGITAMLDARIHLHGRVEGVLCNEQVGAPRAWQTDEHAFAAALANLVALAFEESRRRAAELAVRESERFNISVLDSLVDEVAVLDAEGHILAVNHAWRKFANGGSGADFSGGTGVVPAASA